MKELITQEMTEKEIKDGLKLFSKYLKGINYEHANPLQENCYISSSDIIGVYFPNTTFIDKKHSLYEIASLSKVGDRIGLVYSLKDDAKISEKARIYFDNYIFEDLEVLVFGHQMLDIKKRINARIKDYTNILTKLKSIKRVTKKDGKDFENVLRNFEGVNLSFERSWFDGSVSSIKVGYDTITLYREDEQRKATSEPNAQEIENLIKKYIAIYEGYIEQGKANIKNLESDFLRFKKITQTLKEFKNSVDNWYDFKSVLDSMIL